jgi:hypothetical protein
MVKWCSISKNSVEKALNQPSESFVENVQYNERKYKQNKKADKDFQHFENKPKRDQPCQKNKKRVLKQIIHSKLVALVILGIVEFYEGLPGPGHKPPGK